jgi:hypothetical protein
VNYTWLPASVSTFGYVVVLLYKLSDPRCSLYYAVSNIDFRCWISVSLFLTKKSQVISHPIVYSSMGCAVNGAV